MMRLMDEDDPDSTYLKKRFTLKFKFGSLHLILREHCCESNQHEPKIEASIIVLVPRT